jgi:5-bromo-4-chloroindolyl phosphate hydrolysis protein
MGIIEKVIDEVCNSKSGYDKFKEVMAKNNLTKKEAISLIYESLEEERERADRYEKKLKEAEIIIDFIQNNYNWCYDCDN